MANASRGPRCAPGVRVLLALSLGLMLIAPPQARAERADREKPLNLEADRVTIDDAKQTSLFEGNVVLTQGTTVIRGDRMEVRQDKEGFRYGTTWGNLASFRKKREGFDELIEGWAERIEYDGRAETLQLFNRARMKRGQDEVRGNYISYDAKSEFYQVIGGGAKAASATNPEGRVRAVIQPKPKEKPAASPPVTLKPAEAIATPREEAGPRTK
ncbi:MAG: lipopolysaccharide transport periplasmic protein LptA [Betaproteobacteria bacterium]|nr:lipopolysaccharide transport periplasmic protein LptA [Betaproteobacteria bacterium]